MKPQPDPRRVTGLFGGSFDPVHRGHLNLVRQLHQLGYLEQTIYIPAAVPPHKRNRQVTPGEARLAMLRLALQEEADCYVSDFELKAGGVSYTVDTVRHFAARYSELRLVIGMDSLRDLHNWYRAGDLLEACSVLIYARPGYEPPSRAELIARFGEIQGDALAKGIVNAQTMPISSTAIREAVRGGNAPAELLPPQVWGYIQSHHLYREPD